MNTTLDTYYDRMDTALADKMRVLDHATGTFLLDVGCGSGELMSQARARGFQVHGVDASAESVDRTNGLLGGGYASLAYADELTPLSGNILYDTVIFCSSLHEVFSYGNADGQIGKLKSLRNALQSAANVLKPGGTLIIRDGVRTPGWTGRMWVDDDAAVSKFLKASPFAEFNTYKSASAWPDRGIYINKSSEPGTWRGYPSSLMEFAFTYVWGDAAFDREVQEYYGIFTGYEYKRYVERRGFKMTHYEEYTQQGYIDNLAGKVDFLTMKFPSTNAIWVYTKENV